MTPKERKAIERRIAKLKAEMKPMDPFALDAAGVTKWAALFEELDALESRLENDESQSSPMPKPLAR
jgi:hypothetical protein